MYNIHIYMYAGGAFSAFACHGRHAMRAPAQAACRQPAQLNAPLMSDSAAGFQKGIQLRGNSASVTTRDVGGSRLTRVHLKTGRSTGCVFVCTRHAFVPSAL